MEETKDLQLDGQFRESVSENWLRYAAPIVTASLTGYAGYSLTGNALYVLALILLAEGASLFWTSLTDRNGNPTQSVISVIGLVVAWAAIILTDLSSAAILGNAANIQVFAIFAQVPEWSQRVVVYVLPVLAAGHGLLTTVWYYFSEKAALARKINKTVRDAQRKIAEARADADVSIAQSKAAEYTRRAMTEAPKIGETAGAAMWSRERSKQAEPVEVGQPPAPFGGNGKQPR